MIPLTRSAAIAIALIATLPAPAVTSARQEEPVLGTRSAIRPLNEAEDFVVVEAGALLRDRPHPAAPIVEVIAAPTQLRVLERKGAWLKVRYESWQAWVDPSAKNRNGGASIPMVYESDAQRLLRARSLLGQEVASRELGPFTLYTDVSDHELVDRLDRVARQLLAAYRKRFRLDPGEEFSEAIVLFSREEDYRRFEASEPEIATANTRGFTGIGLTILFAGDLEASELLQSLIHELTHLLNRRTLGPRTPAWLEEGLAEDLAFSRVGPEGRIELGSLGGRSQQELASLGPEQMMFTFELGGAKGSLTGLLLTWSDAARPGLGDLVMLDWEEFIRPPVRALHYAESAFLIRLLLDGGKSSLRHGFLDYLQAVATSAMPERVDLWSHLGEDSAGVETALYRFLRRKAEANGLPIPDRGPP